MAFSRKYGAVSMGLLIYIPWVKEVPPRSHSADRMLMTIALISSNASPQNRVVDNDRISPTSEALVSYCAGTTMV